MSVKSSSFMVTNVVDPYELLSENLVGICPHAKPFAIAFLGGPQLLLFPSVISAHFPPDPLSDLKQDSQHVRLLSVLCFDIGERSIPSQPPTVYCLTSSGFNSKQ